MTLSISFLGSESEECEAQESQPQEQASSRSRRRNRTDNNRSSRIEGSRSYREETARSPSCLRRSWRCCADQGDQRWEPGRGRHPRGDFEAQLGEGELSISPFDSRASADSLSPSCLYLDVHRVSSLPLFSLSLTLVADSRSFSTGGDRTSELSSSPLSLFSLSYPLSFLSLIFVPLLPQLTIYVYVYALSFALRRSDSRWRKTRGVDSRRRVFPNPLSSPSRTDDFKIWNLTLYH